MQFCLKKKKKKCNLEFNYVVLIALYAYKMPNLLYVDYPRRKKPHI